MLCFHIVLEFVFLVGCGCTVAGLWCNYRQMGEMAETNLKGLIHLITTTKDCRLPHSSNMLFVCQAADNVGLHLKCLLCKIPVEAASDVLKLF